MKKGFLALFMLILSTTQLNIHACPTAIGRLTGDTPPLFTAEYDAQFWPTTEEPQTTENTTHDTQKLSSNNKIGK